jgi:undecaprenyl-diphosphatase
MSLLQALFLGLIQGLTEFLPVSSSGHLAIFQNLFGLKEPSLFFDVAVHFGTLLATVIVLRQEVYTLVKGLLSFFSHLVSKKETSPGEDARKMARLAGLIVIGLLPIVLVGFFLQDTITFLFGSLRAVGIFLVVTGILLWTTRAVKEGGKATTTMSMADALTIGIAQACAVCPGISRSGATIACGLFRHLKKTEAVRFSFLLSIPAIIGAMVLKWENPLLHEGELLNLIFGTLMATIVGYICLRVLIGMVQRGHLHYFSPYCWVLGSVAVILSFITK